MRGAARCMQRKAVDTQVCREKGGREGGRESEGEREMITWEEGVL